MTMNESGSRSANEGESSTSRGHSDSNCRGSQTTTLRHRNHRPVGAAKAVGWDQWRFAAPAHHDFSTIPEGGPVSRVASAQWHSL